MPLRNLIFERITAAKLRYDDLRARKNTIEKKLAAEKKHRNPPLEAEKKSVERCATNRPLLFSLTRPCKLCLSRTGRYPPFADLLIQGKRYKRAVYSDKGLLRYSSCLCDAFGLCSGQCLLC